MMDVQKQYPELHEQYVENIKENADRYGVEVRGL